MSKLKKIGITLISLIVIIFLYFYIYPEISTYIPRSIKVKCKALLVEGIYYPINMEQITRLKVDSTKLIMTGYNLSFFEPTPEFKIIRDIPEKFLPLRDLDTTWDMIRISETDNDFEIRTFVNRESNEKVKVWLPFWGGEPIWYVYNISNSNKLFILSAGNWKRSDKVYLVYVLIGNSK